MGFTDLQSTKFLLLDDCGCSELAVKLLAYLSSKKHPSKSVGAWMGWGETSQLLPVQGSWMEGMWGLGLGQRKSSPCPLGSFFFLVGKGLSSSRTLTLLLHNGYPNIPEVCWGHSVPNIAGVIVSCRTICCVHKMPSFLRWIHIYFKSAFQIFVIISLCIGIQNCLSIK